MTGKQSWSAEGYSRNARFVSDLGAEILGWLAPQSGERILDLGCGDGALTERIAATGAQVIGIDTSPELLASAIARGIDARNMDAQVIEFDRHFDAVFSNAVLHWIDKPARVICRIRKALKPGGRFVAEFGGFGNVAAIITAMRGAALSRGADMELAGPWFFPTVDEYTTMLTAAGFEVTRCELHPRATPLPTNMAGWLETFRKPFFDQFEGAERDRVLREVLELLRPSLSDGKGRWTADYVRIRVHALKS